MRLSFNLKTAKSHPLDDHLQPQCIIYTIHACIRTSTFISHRALPAEQSTPRLRARSRRVRADARPGPDHPLVPPVIAQRGLHLPFLAPLLRGLGEHQRHREVAGKHCFAERERAEVADRRRLDGWESERWRCGWREGNSGCYSAGQAVSRRNMTGAVHSRAARDIGGSL